MMESPDQTKYEIFGKLEHARSVVVTPGVGTNVSKQTWEYIDFLLDELGDLEAIRHLTGMIPGEIGGVAILGYQAEG